MIKEIKKYWDKEKKVLRVHHYLKDGKFEGERKFWHKNGKLKEQCFYKNGKLEGEYKIWYENGQLWVQSFYKDGKCYDSKEAYEEACEEACINKLVESWNW